MKKVFVIAMECEAEAVARNFPDAREEKLFGRKVIRGTLGGEPTAVIVSGIGKVNAAASTQLAIATLGAEKVLNVGVAGGLDPKLRVGDLLRVARVVQYDFDLSKINGTPIGTLDEYKTPFFELAVAGEGLPEATVASCTYQGSYTQITEVYAAVIAWMEANGYEPAGPMFNIYHVSPHETQNPDEYVTELCFPIE